VSAHADGTKRPYDALRKIIGPLAAPLYGAVVGWRNRRFDRGIGVRRVPLPVVSVGNLTVGGTGKTPFVMWLCRELGERGVKPAIALRGYGSAATGGRSDEAEEYRAALPDVPVIVSPDRHAGITAFLAGGGLADVVVLDDGFQHRRLHRGLDIVLIDAQAGTLTDRLLPMGDLREGVSSLRRAGVVVLSHADGPAECASLQGLVDPRAVVVSAAYRWEGVSVCATGDGAETFEPVSWLAGRRVVLLCGIGRPQRFIDAARDAGADVVGTVVLADHAPVTGAAVQRVRELSSAGGADVVLTTEKDLARMEQLPEGLRGLTLAAPRVQLSLDRPDALLQEVLRTVRGGGSRPANR